MLVGGTVLPGTNVLIQEDILLCDVTGLADQGRGRTVAIVAESSEWREREIWRALETVFGLAFVDEGSLNQADGVVVLPGGHVSNGLRAPCLVLESAADVGSSPFVVEVSRCDGVDHALRGQRLKEYAGPLPATVPVRAGWRVLATVDGRPVWAQGTGADGQREVASADVPVLGEREFLRDHLTAGRFWSLLPLVHFLKRVSGGVADRPRALDACFMIDDANPRLDSYGHVGFAELARDAREHGYHVAVATIPLDLALPGRRAAHVFRDHPGELSLVVHGNDHVRRELERPGTPAAADRILRSATARVARFERAAGLRVERVMCPPQGRCGAPMLRALFRWGFLGLVASTPFPWRGFSDHARWRLGGWLPAQLAGGGLPILPRYPLTQNLDDLVFRAFLEQPLILYCHHSDLQGSLHRFHAAAARAAELGDVRWRSLASIVRSNAVCTVRHGVATVSVYSHDLRIPRPGGSSIRLQVPRIFGGSDPLPIVVDGRRYVVPAGVDGGYSLVTESSGAEGDLRVRICGGEGASTAHSRHWRPSVWPLARRALTESRDRALPVMRRLRRD